MSTKASFASITHMMLTGDRKTLEVLNPADSKSLAQQMAAAELPAFIQKTIEAADTTKLNSILTTHFSHIPQSPLATEFSYSYTLYLANTAQDVCVYLHKKPVTAEDFYELAVAIETKALRADAITVDNAPADAVLRGQFQLSLLQDAAMVGFIPAKQKLALRTLNQAARSRFDFLYSYKEETLLFLAGKPETPEAFYQLAQTIADRSDARVPPVYVCLHNGTAQASTAALKALQFSLLNDAAKAGYEPAIDAIIDAVILRNDADAKKYFSLEKFNILGYNIKLPRRFHTADDYYLLGTALIIRKDSAHGQPVRGHFFEIEDGIYAERLGRTLVQIATQMRKSSDELRVKASYDALNRVSAALQNQKSAASHDANLHFHACDEKHPQTYTDGNQNAFFHRSLSIMPYADIAAQLDQELLETSHRP
jgi:hypothetical protein